MGQAHVVDHILGIDDQFNWPTHGYMHSGWHVYIIVTGWVVEIDAKTVCALGKLIILPAEHLIRPGVAEFPAKLVACYLYKHRILWGLTGYFEPIFQPEDN